MIYGHGGDIYTYEDMLDFSVNINPLGPSQNVTDAAKRGVEQIAAYPDSRCRKLRKKAFSETGDFGRRLHIRKRGGGDFVYGRDG